MHHFNLARIGACLPVAASENGLREAIGHGAAVVTAPPGTGKTTFVPPLVAELVSARAKEGGQPLTTILTQPRRVATRAAAQRIAHLDETQLGGPVGFTVRGERRHSSDTILEVMTPGVLIRRLLRDPALEGVGAVVLDEVHERSLEGDILVALMAELRQLRDDFVVVAMSATLEAGAFASLLEAAVVDIPSPLHELHIEHRPFHGQRLDHRGVTREFITHVASTVAAAHEEAASDTLVFLPGVREVEAVAQQLSERGVKAEVLPLHGQLSARAQDAALRGAQPGGRSRIVVSTALAESSLTVPGVHLVVDAGLAREVRRDRGRDVTGLVTVSASRASADQRAGRAARLGPGRAIRLYSEQDQAHMPADALPEIMSADLTDAALTLAIWGTPGAEGLAMLTPAPAGAMQQAMTTLEQLGLVRADGSVTPEGERIAQLPANAREARALVEGALATANAQLTAEVIAAVSGGYRARSADVAELLRDLRSGANPAGRSWRRESERLERVISSEHNADTHAWAAGGDAPGAVIALARPEWIARRVAPHSRTYEIVGGSRAAVPEHSPLADSEWIAIADMQRSDSRQGASTGAIIRLAAALSAETALRVAAPFKRASREARIDDGRVQVREEQRLGSIVLSSQPVSATPADAGRALIAHVQADGLGVLDWNDEAHSLRGRLALLHRELGAPWPAVDDESLLTRIDDWLSPDLQGATAVTSVQRINVANALRRFLPWPEAARFDELVPERLEVPSGNTARIVYAPRGDGAPVVAVKLQELFGLAKVPRLVDGRVSVLFHLLSPARRPLAVTDDLTSFFNGPYQEVRKEMRGRYPKHPWPEDPWSAPATARTKRSQPRTS